MGRYLSDWSTFSDSDGFSTSTLGNSKPVAKLAPAGIREDILVLVQRKSTRASFLRELPWDAGVKRSYVGGPS